MENHASVATVIIWAKGNDWWGSPVQGWTGTDLQPAVRTSQAHLRTNKTSGRDRESQMIDFSPRLDWNHATAFNRITESHGNLSWSRSWWIPFLRNQREASYSQSRENIFFKYDRIHSKLLCRKKCHVSLYSHTSTALTTLLTPDVWVYSHLGQFSHQLGVRQFNALLTLPTWS